MNTFCGYYNQGICSSCSCIEDDYSAQVAAKEAKLNGLLSAFQNFIHLPAVHSRPIEFRNKAKFSITGSVSNPIIGLTGESELDQGREILNCPLHCPEINQLIQSLPAFIQLANLSPYSIKNRTGELKGVIAYFSSETKQMYLRLVLRSKESLDRIKKHAPTLTQNFPLLTCLSANIQPVAHAILEGEEEVFFTQQDYIDHKIGGIPTKLHPQGFVQTNQDMAKGLYSTAAEWVRDLGSENFMELFSGQGAFSFFIQKYVKKAVGIEINPEAVARANLTAKEMNWNHLQFVAADAASVQDLAVTFGPDVILVNPPRRGLGEAKRIIQKINAPYFIYSSCNAETLAKDLIDLKENYQIVKAQVFDMFPNTEHFETLVLLRAINADKKQ